MISERVVRNKGLWELVRRRPGLQALVLLLPSLFWLIVFFAFPLLIVLVYSFLRRGPYGQIVWDFNLENYGRFLDPLYLKIFLRSFKIATLTTVFCFLFGFPMAYWMATRPRRWRNAMLLLLMIPFWTNFLVRTYAWILILRDTGLINNLLMSLGLIRQPLPLFGNDFAIIVGLVYGWFPDMVLPCYAAIERLDFSLVEAGQVAKIGMNSAGLGVCLNFLEHADQGMGVPVHVILRQILNCAHLGEAIREAYRLPRGGAANILLGHAAGEVLDLELTATDADFLYADQGWLVHANHFESLRLRGGDRGILTSQSTLARAARARRLFAVAAAQAAVSLDTYYAILTDHAHGNYAICRHGSTSEPPLQQTATRASLVMDLTARTMRVAIGQPCQQPYHSIACSTS